MYSLIYLIYLCNEEITNYILVISLKVSNLEKILKFKNNRD